MGFDKSLKDRGTSVRFVQETHHLSPEATLFHVRHVRRFPVDVHEPLMTRGPHRATTFERRTRRNRRRFTEMFTRACFNTHRY